MEVNGIRESAAARPATEPQSDVPEGNIDLGSATHHEDVSLAAGERCIRTDPAHCAVRYQDLFEFNPDGCLVIDRRGIIRDASQAAARLLRRRKEFLLDKPLAFFLAGSARDFYNHLNGLEHSDEMDRCLEIWLRPRKAEPVHVHVAIAPIPGNGLRPTAFLWLLHDITSRKRAEEHLQAERDFANSVVETAEAFILVLDKYGRIFRCNEYVYRNSGYDPDGVLGQEWCWLFLPVGDHDRARRMFHEALIYGTSKGGPYGFVTKDGSVRVVAWSGRELPDFENGPAVLLAGHDITEIHERQKQILQMERLAAIGQAVTALSHESRNALQRAEACLEILRLRLKDRQEDLELIARVQRAQSDLLRLYEDVRMYAAPVHVERHWCELATVWRQAWEQVSAQFPKKKSELIEQTAGVDLRCEADTFRLTQVFRNLLENAFAACPEPVRITISCREGSLAGHAAVQISVRDNGPGLSEEQRRNIFKPFYTTKVKGTGLGTSIARRIIEAHGGQIEVGDNTQPGTEIVILLPRAQM